MTEQLHQQTLERDQQLREIHKSLPPAILELILKGFPLL